ncbi:MAG: P-II family nitrogen regulator [Tissierellia bacterium]|nr:P-II family nitrogen regulator [Tissierellia bacterium]
MKALFIVINDAKKLTEVSKALREAGFTGGTVLHSEGLYNNYERFGEQPYSSHSLIYMLNQGKPLNKVVFLIMEDERVEAAKTAVRSVIKDFNKDNVGIMFTMPILDVEGLTHREELSD